MLAEEDARSTTPIALLQGLKNDADPGFRRLAVRALGRFEQPELAAAIAPSLSDKDASVRIEAANALAQGVFAATSATDVAEAARVLRARLAREPDPAVRGALALGIGRLRYPSDEAGRSAAAAVLDVALPRGPDGQRAPAPEAAMSDALRGLNHLALARRLPGGPPVTWLTDEARAALASFVAPRLTCRAARARGDTSATGASPPPCPPTIQGDRAARGDTPAQGDAAAVDSAPSDGVTERSPALKGRPTAASTRSGPAAGQEPRPATASAPGLRSRPAEGATEGATPADARLRRQALQALAGTRTSEPLVGLALLFELDQQTRALALRWALEAAWMDEARLSDLTTRWVQRFSMTPEAARAEVAARATLATRLVHEDPSAMVRYDGVRTLTTDATRKLGCAPVLAAMDDEAVAVAAYAMENAHLSCAADSSVRARLGQLSRVVPAAGAPPAPRVGGGPVPPPGAAAPRAPDASPGPPPTTSASWRRSVAALIGYTRVDPPAARDRVVAALQSPSPSTRRYGAIAAQHLLAASPAPAAEDFELIAILDTLVSDPDPNVATQAVHALARQHREARRHVLRALRRDSHELVLEAANALRPVAPESGAATTATTTTTATATTPGTTSATDGTSNLPDAASRREATDEEVVSVALDALARLTSTRRETSRDPRLALVALIGDLGATGDAGRLEPWLRDFDPEVAKAAANAITGIGARAGTPVPARSQDRPTAPPATSSQQPSSAPPGAGGLATSSDRRVTPSPQPLPRLPLPSDADLSRMVTARLVLHIRGRGPLVIRLRPDQAPLNAFRFLRLAEQGYYTGLTFHRIEPNFVVQGGSPEGNEYAGDGPFSRDEVGLLSNRRGTVGLSTRGRDTGDAQFYVNLVDNVRLDHAYTVFAEVESGMEVVDALLEGDAIEWVEIRE
jgi:cyclophilin family peptidyl-prolyl cis-trans isomerase